MTSAPPPDFAAALAGDLSSASCTLSDMAANTVGLLDALGLDSAHLVGASKGSGTSASISPTSCTSTTTPPSGRARVERHVP
jgi:hypothetical protein